MTIKAEVLTNLGYTDARKWILEKHLEKETRSESGIFFKNQDVIKSIGVDGMVIGIITPISGEFNNFIATRFYNDEEENGKA